MPRVRRIALQQGGGSCDRFGKRVVRNLADEGLGTNAYWPGSGERDPLAMKKLSSHEAGQARLEAAR